jgi:hypothetical protein
MLRFMLLLFHSADYSKVEVVYYSRLNRIKIQKLLNDIELTAEVK